MKTAIYIEDGTVQLVVTPESEFEKNALTLFEDKAIEVKVFTGAFYDCRGGWVRQRPYFSESPRSNTDDRSIIVRIRRLLRP